LHRPQHRDGAFEREMQYLACESRQTAIGGSRSNQPV